MSDFVDFNIPMDLTEDRAWDGTTSLLPPGEYVVSVAEAAQTDTRNGGSGIKVTFVVDDEASQHHGQKVFKTYSLKNEPGPRSRLKALLLACGNTSFTSINASMIVGRRLSIEVTHSQGREQTDSTGQPIPGKMLMNVQGERSLDDGTVEEVPPPPPPATRGRPVGSTGKANGSAAVRR